MSMVLGYACKMFVEPSDAELLASKQRHSCPRYIFNSLQVLHPTLTLRVQFAVQGGMQLTTQPLSSLRLT